MANVKKLISLDENLAKELEFLSKTLKKTQKEIIENALDFYFDYMDGLIADKISEEIENGKMKVYDAEEVFKELDIDV